MAAWRILGSLLVLLAAVGAARSQTYELTEPAKPGDCFRLHLDMTLAGELKVTRDGKPAAIKLAAAATQEYAERILEVASTGMVRKTARVYASAKADITVGQERSQRTLREERHLVVVQHGAEQALVYCPAGPLTREELELTGEHFDSLALTGLLPGKAVAVTDTWKVRNEIVQALCNFDGITGQDLVCKLEEVKDNIARVSVAGTAGGIDLGALVKLTVQGSCRFDLTAHRLVGLEWKQKDDRGQGPANPASIVETTTTLTRTAIDLPPTLSDVALISVPDGLEPPTGMTQLAYHHQDRTNFDLVYGRAWQMVGNTHEHVIMRLMDRGDFVAQVTITPWDKARPGEHMSAQAFREAMAKTPGWEQGDVVQEGELPADGGRWVYRVSAPGTMDGLKVFQNFFLVAGPAGEQVVVAFTMTPAQAEKLGTRDVDLVRGLDFPKAAAEATTPK